MNLVADKNQRFCIAPLIAIIVGRGIGALGEEPSDWA